MKQFAFIFCLLSFFISQYACSVANSAKNKTTREISKKTNEKIGDVFNKKDKNKKEPNDEEKVADKDHNENKENPSSERNASDFIPGDKIIFIDTLKREIQGEFPSKWDLTSGNIEIMKFEDKNVIGFATGGTIFPLIDKTDYLPETFTIEFECYFHNYGNEAYTPILKNSGQSFAIRSDGISGSTYSRTNVKNKVGWRHIAISFNKRSLKVYYNGERLINIPNVKNQPTNIAIKALGAGYRQGKYAMIKNIRIAEGGVPLYDRLISDGKFVTNDINFEYNSAEIKSDSWRTILKIADMMKKHEDVILRIEGHTDGDGTDAYNLDLSEKRANSVKNALIKEGITANKLSIKGFGESQPIAANNSEEGKAQNRRVAFVLID